MRKCGYDWMQIVHDLFAVGYTNGRLSELVGVEPNLFTMIRSGVRGHQPSYEVGSKLVALWTQAYIPLTYPKARPVKAKHNGQESMVIGSINPEQQQTLFIE